MSACQLCGIALSETGAVYRTDDGVYCCGTCATMEGRLRAQAATVAHLADAVTRDALTGTMARSQMTRVWDCLAPGQSVGVLFIDVDHFKAINDQWGHPVGDQVLAAVARRLTAPLRPTDGCFRYGGEEFVILLPGVERPVAVGIAERLRHAVAASPVSGKGWSIPVTVSIGVVVGRPETPLETWTIQADAALYSAKRQGRNRVVPYAAPELGDLSMPLRRSGDHGNAQGR